MVFIEAIFGVVSEYTLILFWWLILFPVVWLVSLPFVLILALFRRETYGVAVAGLLTSVYYAWRDWALFITP